MVHYIYFWNFIIFLSLNNRLLSNLNWSRSSNYHVL
nr:MAG TPA: hypothetical protein [Caudoviricetes sp.]